MAIPREIIPLTLFTMIPIVIIFAPIARAIAKRIERGPSDSSNALPNDVTARLDRMEQAIDAIAVEVERISEGQRFTSKLLAGRPELSREESPLARTRD